jgi:hypothetical protein
VGINIEPCPMGVIVPRLVDLDKSSINEPNIILKLWDIGI